MQGIERVAAVMETGQGAAPSVSDSAKLGVWLHDALDRGSPVPLYYQVAQALQRLIESGEVAVGSSLGNEADLARAIGISRPTVRRALGYLADSGLLLRMRGLGTVVMPVPIHRNLGLTSVYDDLIESGHLPTTRILSMQDVTPPVAVSGALGLAEGKETLHLRRLRLVDDQPLAIMENYLPSGLVHVSREQLEATGLYRVLRAAGAVPRVASQTIGARIATPEEVELMALEDGAAILQLQRVSYDETGRAIEYASHAYIAARHSFKTNLISEARAAQP